MRPDDTAPDGAVLIPLRARNGSIRAYAIVDAADADWVNRYRWALSGGYAFRTTQVDGRKRTLWLHREILGLTSGDGLSGDHKNRDRLDNRRSNLRPIPRPSNSQNKGVRPGSSSRYRGVSWDASRRKWVAQVNNGRHVYLGRFDDEIEAARAARQGRARLLPYAVD